eukprot:COSAG05_NODE_15328_length_372_cov_1.029304_1_plen_93_part_10
MGLRDRVDAVSWSSSPLLLPRAVAASPPTAKSAALAAGGAAGSLTGENSREDLSEPSASDRPGPTSESGEVGMETAEELEMVTASLSLLWAPC